MFNEDEDVDEDNDVNEDTITYKESLFKSIIVDIRNKLSKNGDKLIKKGLYHVDEMKELTESQVKNIKEKLIKFKNELIRQNRLNNKIRRDFDDYNGDTKYKDIKDIRCLFNKEDIYNSINNIKYLLNENKDYYEDKISDVIKRDTYYAEKIKKYKIKITHKESLFKSIIENIKIGLYMLRK